MTELTDPLVGVDATARWTAAARALERQQPEPLIDDPWAECLAGEEGMAWLHRQRPGGTLSMVIRARFFDDWLGQAMADRGIRQAVLLGAGLDTRAWRLAWPAGFAVFEVDRASVLDAKATALEAAGATAACRYVPVAADLGEHWTGDLLTAGFDPTMPAAWLAEGLLFYLPDPLVRDVLHAVTHLAPPGSRLGFDIPNGAVLTSPYTKPWIEMQAAAGAPWLGTMDDPAAELGPMGWGVAVTQPGEGDTGHGRYTAPVLPPGEANLPRSWYVTAVRAR